MDLAHRTAGYEAVSTALAGADEHRLAELVSRSASPATGIGGATGRIDMSGVPVFVKRVPLTDVELRAGRTTSDLFGLPAHYHYGMGSTGFGAWRELAAHEQTTEWVLSGDSPGFPLLYHWRVLPEAAPEAADIDAAVRYWGTDVRHRLERLRDAPASLVLFTEYIPDSLARWVADPARRRRGYELADAQLESGIEAMNSRHVR